MPGILGTDATVEDRLSASFEPIIAELEGGRRPSEARQLEALLERIRSAN